MIRILKLIAIELGIEELQPKAPARLSNNAVVDPNTLNINTGNVFLFQSDEMDRRYHVTTDQSKGYRDIPAYYKLPVLGNTIGIVSLFLNFDVFLC